MKRWFTLHRYNRTATAPDLRDSRSLGSRLYRLRCVGDLQERFGGFRVFLCRLLLLLFLFRFCYCSLLLIFGRVDETDSKLKPSQGWSVIWFLLSTCRIISSIDLAAGLLTMKLMTTTNISCCSSDPFFYLPI